MTWVIARFVFLHFVKDVLQNIISFQKGFRKGFCLQVETRQEFCIIRPYFENFKSVRNAVFMKFMGFWANSRHSKSIEHMMVPNFSIFVKVGFHELKGYT